jgi:kumamolisin
MSDIPDRVVPCAPFGRGWPNSLSPSPLLRDRTINVAFNKASLDKLRQRSVTIPGDTSGRKWVLVSLLVSADDIESSCARPAPDLESRPRRPKQPLKNSARVCPPQAKPNRRTGADEQMTVRIILRRRVDQASGPSLEEYLRTPAVRPAPLEEDAYAGRYGASEQDIAAVLSVLTDYGLTNYKVHAASRAIDVTGTASSFEELFDVVLSEYEILGPDEGVIEGSSSSRPTHRSHEGPVMLPGDVAELIVGVVGLDNRPISASRAVADAHQNGWAKVPQVVRHYNFPTNNANGQTVGIFATRYRVQAGSNHVCGYNRDDIAAYYRDAALAGLGLKPPVIIAVQDVDETENDRNHPDPEVTQDICIASTVAQGADIAVYFNRGDELGWLEVIRRAAFPGAGDPRPSVLSSSFNIANGDDAAGLQGTPECFLDNLNLALQDAAAQGLTVCIASGDFGAPSNVSDNKPHVQYPASDPWVLACGGTMILRGTGSGSAQDVWMDQVWNDPPHGATGGGVSAHFEPPYWQHDANVTPESLLFKGTTGRGVPDVAANASVESGYYPIYVGGVATTADGTSAAAPLYAGLFAVINAALGRRVGFVNPLLYQSADFVCKSIDPSVTHGPANNNYSGVEGYLAGPGWDPCTGWGTIDGRALLRELGKIT